MVGLPEVNMNHSLSPTTCHVSFFTQPTTLRFPGLPCWVQLGIRCWFMLQGRPRLSQRREAALC